MLLPSPVQNPIHPLWHRGFSHLFFHFVLAVCDSPGYFRQRQGQIFCSPSECFYFNPRLHIKDSPAGKSGGAAAARPYRQLKVIKRLRMAANSARVVLPCGSNPWSPPWNRSSSTAQRIPRRPGIGTAHLQTLLATLHNGTASLPPAPG